MSDAYRGLSDSRLTRLTDLMEKKAKTGEVVGAIALLERKGEQFIKIVGWQDRERKVPLRRDSIFRIASMTKPITAVAAMILVEEGLLSLDAPISKFIPELASPRVLVRPDADLDQTIPANREITLRDLLTFRLGWGMMLDGSDNPIDRALMDSQIGGLKPRPTYGPDEWIRNLSRLPLMSQPGERWIYHTGSDVLGLLISRASSQTLGAFFQDRIFSPLGMSDTAFTVPPGKIHRLCSAYDQADAGGEPKLYDDGQESLWAEEPPFPAGGSGLVSTVDDYLLFARMMLNMGQSDQHRILSRATVQAMTTDQLTQDQKARSNFSPGFWDSRGWGFGVGVTTHRGNVGENPGQFGWDGAFSTAWTADPAEDLTCLLMMQQLSFGPQPATLYGDFLTLAYQALDD
jgi:CubicO group peptidase (beta-lactamase class C family)